MNKNELKERLLQAESLEDVKNILEDQPNDVVERISKEFEIHRLGDNRKLDLDELDTVSGGADRDWTKDGCAATCESGSWCGSNDYCYCFDVTYDNFWATCPDGTPHQWSDGPGYVCVKCGHNRTW